MAKKNLFFILIVFVVLSIVFVYSFQEKLLLKKMNLVPQKESFTELYFSNYDTFIIPQEQYQEKPFSFGIHNLENKDMKYLYEVYLLLDGKRQNISSGTTFIKNGGIRMFKESFSTAYSNKRYKVIVNLINKKQSIDFWINS